ncbi:hypothetical protein CEXT_458291 [Caerostris extrusa]|uniref:Uncharacterized protein n=1 Tax=Caerostris extrusa TaxID=172846 RepID=A0AAV4Y8Q6_CAEEX|nr:hypothetical protein CEXT_458291 [Caerostris extrusa]
MQEEKKITEMGHEEINQSVSETFPTQLRQHALLKGREDVGHFISGVFIYAKEPQETKKTTRSEKARSTKRAQKRKRRPEPFGTFKRKRIKRLKTKTHKKEVKTKERTLVKVKGKSLKLGKSLVAIGEKSNNYTKAVVSLEKETAHKLGGILENICNSIILKTVENANNSKEIGEEEIKASTFELLPKTLAEHAQAIAKKNCKLLNSVYYVLDNAAHV